MSMFCYQCEQTAKGTGCTVFGVCGKDETTANLQDLLLHATEGVSMYAHRARELGAVDPEVDVFAVKALFSTVTNVNFDPDTLKDLVLKATEMRDRAKRLYEDACGSAGKMPEKLNGPAVFVPEVTVPGMTAQAASIAITKRIDALGADITGLQELLTYGIKGAAAYADHAQTLGKQDEKLYASFHEALNFLTKPTPTVDELLAMNLKAGEINLKAMELLDAGNTGTYGHPVPTKVPLAPRKGKAILVSGT
jgi:hydroxylamine reductase